MIFWSLDHIQQTTDGRWLVKPPPEARAAGVSIDTRTCQPGQAFVAIRGDRTDGHRYLDQAIAAGAILLIIDEAETLPDDAPPTLLVRDTTATLTDLAVAYRGHLSARVVAVTGSAGKTTTKHLIRAAVGDRLRGTVSPKSFNNHIGVPLTLLGAHPDDQYVVAEVGTNALGEIAQLAHIVRPDIAVITTVGPAHLEGLGSTEKILEEKSSLLDYVEPGGLAVLNGDVAGLAEQRPALRRVLFGHNERCDLRLTAWEPTEDGQRFEINGKRPCRLNIFGEHNATNAIAAFAVARELGIDPADAAAGLAQAEPPQMRLAIERIGPATNPITLINDAYNANPLSMRAALGVLRRYPTQGRRIAVLGDMGELGPEAPEFHRRLGEQIAESAPDRVVLVGPLCTHARDAITAAGNGIEVTTHEQWSDDLPTQAAGWARPGDVVLIKASRSMGLERLIPGFGANGRRSETTN